MHKLADGSRMMEQAGPAAQAGAPDHPRDDLPWPARRQAVFALVVLMIGYIVSFIDRQILSLMVQPIKADLGVSDFAMSLLQGFAFALFFCVLGIPFGRLADRRSRKHIIAAGVLLWSLMTIACGFAGTYAMLFVARMGVGVGEAALAPAGYSLLADMYRKERLVRAMSIFTLGGMIGGGLAFLVGGQVIDYATAAEASPLGIEGLRPWQFSFIVVGLPGLLVALLFLLVHEPARRGAARGPQPRFGEALAYLWGRRADYAPVYLAATFMAVLSYGGLTWFPTHLIRAYGLGAGETGAILGTIHIVAPVLGATLATVLTERFTARGLHDAPLRTIGLIAPLAGLFFMAPLMPTKGLTIAMWFLAVLFSNAYYGVSVATLQTLTPNNLRATNSAMLTLVVSLGGLAIGAALIGGLADALFLGDPRGIGKALALVCGVSAAAATVVARRGRARIGRLLETA
ncbi:MAG: MFS transporter [Sphingomonadales bacterium]|nr:MFS transporter [Sphingomonadales bacterium]